MAQAPKKTVSPRTNAALDLIGAPKLAALKVVHDAILKAAPAATESQTYGARGYRVDGMPVVGLGASARFLSLYVMSSGVMAAFAEAFDELGLRYSKGTVQFTPDNPLPPALVRRIVKARLAENARLMQARKARRAKKAAPGRRTLR